MNIRATIRLFGGVLITGLVIAACVGGYMFYAIGLGGPLYGQIIQGKDLVADILPPPAYVVEAYLEATLAANRTKPAEDAEQRIKTLRKEYEDRHAVWQQSDLPREITGKLVVESDAKVRQLWDIIETGLIPALKRDDRSASETAYRKISSVFAEHRALIEEVVAAANKFNAGVEENSARQKSFAVVTLAAVVLFLLGLLIGSIIALGRWIIDPVIQLGQSMTLMAAGNMDTVVPGVSRNDEIGTMAKAAIAFRDAAIAKTEQDALRAEQDRLAALSKSEQERIAAEQKVETDRRAVEARDAALAKMMTEFDAAVGGIVKAATAGDFSQRVPLEGKEGVIRNLAGALNTMCDNMGEVMDDLVGILGALAQGDLTKRISAPYEGTFGVLKESANSTAERLADTISRIKASAAEVASASSEISTSATDLSQRTETQAAGLEETSASMEEISVTIRKTAENAQQASTLSVSTQDVAGRGGAVVAEAVEAMSRIEDSSRRIGDIIGVIDEIARQTNLLALNAAVEAARAGEAGRGFAVVASEVRSLAQRSSQAAKDIKDLISNSTSQVKEGVDLVNRAGVSLKDIVDAIKQVSDFVANIASASGEQTTGLDQINRAIAQMDELTQQNSALVEESAATAKTLEQQARTMDQLIGVFRIEEGGRVATKAVSPAPRSAAKPASRGGNVGRMQAAVATAFKKDFDTDEF